MTSVGHTLTGISIGTAAMPMDSSRWRMVLVLNLCGLAANVPDLPLPGWGHGLYHVSHSLFVTLALIAGLALLLAGLPRVRRALGGWRAAGLVGLAWLSHMLLDSFYAHGRGIAIFWPVSDAHLALPIPWLHTIEVSPWAPAYNLRVFGIELLCYGALLAAVIVARVRLSSRSRRTDRGGSARGPAYRSARSPRARGDGTS